LEITKIIKDLKEFGENLGFKEEEIIKSKLHLNNELARIKLYQMWSKSKNSTTEDLKNVLKKYEGFELFKLTIGNLNLK